MKRVIAVLSVLFTAILTLPASAGHLDTVHLLPVAGHATGANGTFWQSDIAVFNPNTDPITLEILFVEAGEGLVDNVTNLQPRQGETLIIPGRSSLRVLDVLGAREEFQDVTGALIVGAEEPFTITSRSFTVTDSGGSYGQTVPPADEFIHGPGDSLLLSALSSAVSARSNIGFVATADDAAPLVLEIHLLAADGTTLGSRTVMVPAAGATQLQLSTAEISTTSFDSGAAEIVVLSGSGAVSGYASVIDNITGDAVFVTGAASRSASTATSLADANERLMKLFEGEKER